jgi:hypothetical protein
MVSNHIINFAKVNVFLKLSSIIFQPQILLRLPVTTSSDLLAKIEFDLSY